MSKPTAEQHAQTLIVLSWLTTASTDPIDRIVLQAAATRVWESLTRLDQRVTDE